MNKTAKARILIIDDDPDWIRIMTPILEQAGFQVSGVLDGKEGIRRVYADKPDLILLDILMPKGLNGFEVLDHIRLATDVPVMMLTTAVHESNEIQSYEKGALAFLSKSASRDVMVANIRSKLNLLPARRPPRRVHVVDDDLTIDVVKHTVHHGDTVVELTPTQWRVLECLLERQGQIVTFQELLRAGWHESDFRDTRVVKVLISQLRKKLNDTPRAPRYIHTIRELGYSFGVG